MDTRTHPSLNTDEAHVTTSHERKCVTYEQPHTEQQFFSIAFQRYEALTFYSQLLKKVITFAKTLDEGTPAIRESIWQQLYSLLGTPDQQADGRHFLPLLSEWLREPTINLFGLELLYIVFMLTTSGHSHLNLATSSQTTTTKEFSPWGSTIPCALYQLSLVSELITSHTHTERVITLLHNKSTLHPLLAFFVFLPVAHVTVALIALAFAVVVLLDYCSLHYYLHVLARSRASVTRTAKRLHFNNLCQFFF